MARWQQRITNVEVRRRVGNTKNIVQIIMERKLSLFGHICRMEDNRLVKGVVFGIIDGQTRRGRPSRATPKNGVRWTSAISGGWRGTVHSGEGSSYGHWTPTGASPWNDWMAGMLQPECGIAVLVTIFARRRQL